MSKGKAVAVVAIAVLAALLVVRAGVVAAYVDRNPSRAAAVWAKHPAVQLRVGFEEIGMASAKGQPATPAQISRMERASLVAPLQPEPFIVRGVAASLAGDRELSGRAFAAAVRRNPRSLPAHYFLADYHLRAGDNRRGLAEITALSRLVPSKDNSVAAMLASYARSPGAAGGVKAMLRTYPDLETGVLGTLTADPANTDLILYLSNGNVGDPVAIASWQSNLVGGLVKAGQFVRAHQVWSKLAKIGPQQTLLFNPKFEATSAPAPFNWTLTSAATGLAEPQNGGVHILYYGRETTPLVSQLLMLAPGRYALSFRMSVAEGDPAPLAWTLTCLPANQAIFTVKLDKVAKANGGATGFAVPAGCRAQRLELIGTAPDYPETVDVAISDLSIAREGAR